MCLSDVKALSSEDKEDLAAFPFDEEAEFQALGGALPVGEKGFTTLERRYCESSNTLYARFMHGLCPVAAFLLWAAFSVISPM